MKNTYNISASGNSIDDVTNKLESSYADVNNKFRAKHVAKLKEPNSVLYTVHAYVAPADIPKGVSGNLRTKQESEESFEKAMGEAEKVLPYKVSFSDFKCTQNYELTKRQFAVLHPTAKKRSPPAVFDERVNKYDSLAKLI